MKQIITTGEDRIDQIIQQNYPNMAYNEAMRILEDANRHIVSLTSLCVGDVVNVPMRILEDANRHIVNLTSLCVGDVVNVPETSEAGVSGKKNEKNDLSKE